MGRFATPPRIIAARIAMWHCFSSSQVAALQWAKKILLDEENLMIPVKVVSVAVAAWSVIACAQTPRSGVPPLQPLALRVQQIEKALAYPGQPLPAEESPELTRS